MRKREAVHETSSGLWLHDVLARGRAPRWPCPGLFSHGRAVRAARGTPLAAAAVLLALGGSLAAARFDDEKTAAEPPAHEAAVPENDSPTKGPAETDDADLARRSRAWYILGQSDADSLWFGLAPRLGKAIVPSRRSGPAWQGVEGGGSVELDIDFQGEVDGEIFVGFFADPRWWFADPAQVRRFPKAGRYTVDRLPPGKFHVAAMKGDPIHPKALGVHRSWPEPIEIRANQSTRVELRVSEKFRFSSRQTSAPEKLDPTRLITVRTFDAEGNVLPFSSVTLASFRRDAPAKIDRFFELTSDDKGYAYCDQIDGRFKLMTSRFDTVPEQFANLGEFKELAGVFDAQDRPVVTVTWEPYPTGRGEISGRVHDQNGRPLTEYFLTLTYQEGDPRRAGHTYSHWLHLPVTDAEGRFQVNGLAPGVYKVRVRHFDYPTHAWSFDGPEVTVPEQPDATAEIDVEVEAKELRYGRAVFNDGTPVAHGGYIAWFKRHDADRRGTGFSLGTARDGSFRVALSRAEREQLAANSKGSIEVYDYGKQGDRLKVEIPFDDLSADRERPMKVVLPGTDDAADEIPMGGDNEKDGAAPRGDSDQVSDSPRPRARDFELVDVTGRTHKLSDYRGRVVWMNFFGTSREPCAAEWPKLVELHKRHAEAGLVVLAVSEGEQAETVEAFASRREAPFSVLVDADRQAARQFSDDIRDLPLPTNVLVDRNGRVAMTSMGFTEAEFARLTATLDELLSEKRTAPADAAVDGKPPVEDRAPRDGAIKVHPRFVQTNHMLCLAVSDDGALLAGGGFDSAVRIWNLPGGELRRRLAIGGTVRSLAFAPRSTLVAAVEDHGKIRIWDAATGELKRTIQGLQPTLDSVTFSPNGRRVATCSNSMPAKGQWTGEVLVFDVASGELIRTVETPANGYYRGVAFSPDGTLLAAAFDSIEGDVSTTGVKLWDTTSWELRRTLLRRRGGSTSVAFSPDGRLVANGGGYVIKKDGRPAFGEAMVWNVETGVVEHTLRVPLRDAAQAGAQDRGSGYVWVVFAADGKALFGTCFVGRSLGWDLRSGLPLWSDDGAPFCEAAPAVTPNGHFVAISDRETVRLLDATNGETVRVLMRKGAR
ncbi:MAG TPA: redoxin domain-containing protein [Pirellulales bacterium]|nr:redoxin domain-containing protein [Pirellulales bacterium]